MKKRKHPLTPEMIDEAAQFVESVLIERSVMLPTRPHQVTDDDIARFGHGEPRNFAELEGIVAAIEERARRVSANGTDIRESLAMAARNGEQISEVVWARMHADRKRAEERGGK